MSHAATLGRKPHSLMVINQHQQKRDGTNANRAMIGDALPMLLPWSNPNQVMIGQVLPTLLPRPTPLLIPNNFYCYEATAQFPVRATQPNVGEYSKLMNEFSKK